MISKVEENINDNKNISEIDTEEKLPKEVYVIAQEIKIIKSLSGNNAGSRLKQLKKLRKWLTLRSNSSYQFEEHDFLRIWKGLYYCMWMSDKPLVQEELAENLGKLIECFSSTKVGIDFFGCFLLTLQSEWFGIDQWRMDKFLMLVRRMLRYALKSIKKTKWSAEMIKTLNEHIYKCLESPCYGLSMHILDIFFEELAKVAEGKILSKHVTDFVKPFIKYIAEQKEYKLLAHMRNRVFAHLLYQSQLGREYSERYQAWKEMGFPTKSIDDIELCKPGIPDNSHKNNINNMDPRAGNVDVFMPILPLDPNGIIHEIESIMYKEFTNAKSRKHLRIILENFQTYKSGIFPLGIKTMPILEKGKMKPLVENELLKIEKLDVELHNSRRSLKALNKKQRKRFLSSLDLSEATEDNMDDIIEKQLENSSFLNICKAQQNHRNIIDDWLEEDITPEEEHVLLFQEKTSKCRKLKAKIVTNKEEVPSKKFKHDQQLVLELPNEKNKLKCKEPFKADSEWDVPLKENEMEYFVPSKKLLLKRANAAIKKDNLLVPNPFANTHIKSWDSSSKLKEKLKGKTMKASKVFSTPDKKKVTIALKQNASQSVADHIKQVRSSPLNPYDASKLPSKGLLKPNSIPGPINPYYKKKLKLSLNDTI
ncbi:RRP1B family protein [Megaselia abdita]